MELFKKETQIDFIGMKSRAIGLSVFVCIVFSVIIFVRGLNVGLDFSGGVEIETRLSQPLSSLEKFKAHLNKHHLSQATVKQPSGLDHLFIRFPNTSGELLPKVVAAVRDYDPQAQILKTEMVGAQVGADLKEKGAIAALLATAATMVYIAVRFQYKLAFSAALALIHDAIIIVGFFSAFQIEFNVTVLAALLAILGYSLNDTIVVFDRIRENFKKRYSRNVEVTVNQAINQTLSRTIMTSLLTFLVALSLLVFGGESLTGFSMVLCLGIVVGTYSSIYVASALVVYFGLNRLDLLTKPRTVDHGP